MSFGDVIGLTGFMQSGKDTVAKYLWAYGYERIALADGVRDGLYALNPIVSIEHPVQAFASPDMYVYTRLRTLVDSEGWEGAKRQPDVRLLMQRFGTEAVRDVVGEDSWIRAAQRKMREGGKYVISDVRFPNEAAWIGRLGGSIWKIIRPGYGSSDHPSESEVKKIVPDCVIDNNGTLEELATTVAAAERSRSSSRPGFEFKSRKVRTRPEEDR